MNPYLVADTEESEACDLCHNDWAIELDDVCHGPRGLRLCERCADRRVHPDLVSGAA